MQINKHDLVIIDDADDPHEFDLDCLDMFFEAKSYEIIRPLLWFCKGDIVTEKKLFKYFKKTAIEELITYSYIK